MEKAQSQLLRQILAKDVRRWSWDWCNAGIQSKQQKGSILSWKTKRRAKYTERLQRYSVYQWFWSQSEVVSSNSRRTCEEWIQWNLWMDPWREADRAEEKRSSHLETCMGLQNKERWQWSLHCLQSTRMRRWISTKARVRLQRDLCTNLSRSILQSSDVTLSRNGLGRNSTRCRKCLHKCKFRRGCVHEMSTGHPWQTKSL